MKCNNCLIVHSPSAPFHMPTSMQQPWKGMNSHPCLQPSVPSLVKYSFEIEFLSMRVESHRSPAIYQQLLRAIWSGLTYRLYILSLRIDAIKVKLEVSENIILLYISYLT